ncbi:MAG TPA: hypothetical protein VFQ53_23850 [Kofleriaceae bacterium]|nr:hypothetical protein [Kofleriaceae bacterium]
MRFFLLALVLALIAAPARAFAEDIASYDVEGDAEVGAPDPRVAALDEAFARAVSAALVDVIDNDVRRTNKAVIDREIVGRARLWVARFSVTKDETVDGRRQLTVTVRVDRDKMRARLAELNLGAQGPGEQPGPGTHTAVILLRTTDGTTTRASYGATAEKDLPGLGALASVLRGQGFAVKRAPAAGPAARATGELPLSDDDADALAAQTKAEVVAIAGVTIGAPSFVRGVALPAVLVQAHVRALGQGKKPIGQGAATMAARGSEPTVVNAAIDRALVAAATDVMPPKQTLTRGTGFQGDDTPVGEPGIVLVRLAPKTPYALVAAELKYLAGAKGVSRAVLRRMSPGGWVIGVTTAESTQRIANILKKAPTADTSAQVKIAGDLIEVGLSP